MPRLFRITSALPWILGVLGACFVLQVLLQGGLGKNLFSSFRPDALWAAGSVVPLGIAEKGEIWRLFTGTMLHAHLPHFLMNAYALVQLGRLAESIYGPARFTLVYLLAALGGAGASAFWNSLGGAAAVGSVGASGAICGILGLLIGKLRRDPSPAAEAYLRQLLTWAVMILVIGIVLSDVIDNAGHVGGFVTGFALAYLLPTGHFAHLQKGWRRWWSTAAAGLLAALALAAALFAGFTAKSRLETWNVLSDLEASAQRLAAPAGEDVRRIVRRRWMEQEVPAGVEPYRKELVGMVERTLETGAPLPRGDVRSFNRRLLDDAIALWPDRFVRRR